MSTPASGDSAYATIAQFLTRYDVRTVSQLLSDTNKPLTPAQVGASTDLTELLQECSGEVEASCTVGGRYLIDPTATPPINDLASLTGNSQKYLVGLVCTLCMGKLYDRRPDRKSEEPKSCEAARKKLEAMEEGKAVFGILENALAGTLNNSIDSPRTYDNRRTTVVLANRFFGRRVQQFPQNQP